MRGSLPFVLLLTLVTSSQFAPAEDEDRSPDAAVARAEPDLAPVPSPDEMGAVVGPEMPLRRAITTYGRAIERRDVALFRSLMPGMDPDAAMRLRESFRTIESQRVDMAIDSIDIDGTTATVRVSRVDTIDGRRMKLIRQNFHFVRQPSGWQIQSLSIGR